MSKLKFRKTLYDYDVTLIRVVDGDTMIVMIDKGIKQYAKMYIRFARINADELTSSDPAKRKRALEARDYLTDRIPVGSQLYIISNKLDTYDRPISEVYYNDVNINDELLEKGLVNSYEAK